MPLTPEEVQAKDSEATRLIRERYNRLQKRPIRGYFTKRVVSNLLPGMRLIVVDIDFLENIVTFKLAE